MLFSDIVGEIRIETDEIATFIQHWFNPEDRVVITGRKVTPKVSKAQIMSFTRSAQEVCELGQADWSGLSFADESRWNVYFGVCPAIKDIEGPERGKESNVAYVPGVWADLDVKEGSFTSTEDVMAFLYGLPIKPTLVVGSGSGGVHAYWKFAPGEKGDKEHLDRWWSFLDETAVGKSIDKLTDTTRMLRVPGTIYFPKQEAEDQKMGAVTLIHYSTDVYTVAQIESISEQAYKTKREKRNKIVMEDHRRRDNIDLTGTVLDDGSVWMKRLVISQLESEVNEKMPWADILEPHGWVMRRKQGDDSLEWARPLQDGRSAVTDYEDSHVMSLLSSSVDTRLADLKDAGIVLTKYRVLLRLGFDDDENAMVHSLIAHMVKQPDTGL